MKSSCLGVREFASRGVVVGSAVGFGQLLREDAFGGDDDEPGEFTACIGKHFLVLEFDRLLGFYKELVGSARRFLCLFIEEFLGRLARFIDDARGLELRLLDDGAAFLLRGGELGLHLVRISEAGRNFLLTLVESRDDGLERELPEYERNNAEIQDLRQKEWPADAELLGDFGQAAGGFAVVGDRFRDMAGGLSENEQ